MRKILTLFLGFLLLSSIQTTKKDNFLNEVKNGYAQYEVVCDVANDNYSVCVVRGVNKNQESIGIYFYSECKDEYYFTLSGGTEEYAFKVDSNGEVYYPAMTYSSNLEARVYNCDEELIESYTIKTINKATFVGTAGGNQGVNFTSPKSLGGANKTYVVIYIVGIGIIAMSAIIIIILKVSHKGMFNEQTRKEGIVEFKHLEETYVNDELHEESSFEEDLYAKEEPIKVYERTRDYDDELDSARPSVKSLLEGRGYRTEYDVMNVEEKNKVMVELMMMREQKVINNDEYQHEIIELWKK